MDEQKRRVLEEGLLRLARAQTWQGVTPFGGERWTVPIDIYETEEAFVIYLELAGVDPATIQVMVEETCLTVSSARDYPLPTRVRRIHRLEIDRGYFEKRISLPQPIAVATAETEHRHGLLIINLPKQRRKIKIPVSAG